MTANGYLQLAVFVAVLATVAPPLGWYMARIYEGRPVGLNRVLGAPERWIYRVCLIDPSDEMPWTTYALAVIVFNGVGLVVVMALELAQGILPANPRSLPGLSWHLAFDTAVSFVTNTNWQSYGGETTMSHLTQMLGLAVWNFLSAATGMAVLVAFIRGIARRTSETIGNFWVDVVRGTLYILLPLSIILALALVSQGVVQTLGGDAEVRLLQPVRGADGSLVTTQRIPLGPAASQVAIKQLGTNGGGFYNANSAHPLENPTPLSGFLEVLAILLIPAAQCLTFGRLVRDARQGWALLAAMTLMFVPLLLVTASAESKGVPGWASLGIDQRAGGAQPGGNMEGKEARFWVVGSALWATATTAASNGSVNAMHDSLTPIGGLVPMWLMQLGEVVFGGVGSGLYGMIVFVIIAVFAAGLMVGRTPEYLGKKIELGEMKMAVLAVLIPAAAVLVGTAVAVTLPRGLAAVQAPGPHGFSEVLYAFSSAGNNNGSAFAGLSTNEPFYDVSLAVAMLLGRYGVILPVLAIAGSLARKKTVPTGPGTLPTHTPLFVMLLIGTVVLIGALTFIPALALGPIVDQLKLLAGIAGGTP
jgi:K+-transporting ATPase ATPase A chain